MTIQLGQIAPDFTQDSSIGPLSLHAYLGNSWGVLFSHPKDFTPVCTTELAVVARLAPEWEKRNVKPIGLSVDSTANHESWGRDIEETQGQAVNFPLIADSDRTVSNLYGMVHPEADPSVTVRSVFIIDPNKKVRLTLTYPPSAGRNFSEILRCDRQPAADRRQQGLDPGRLEAGRACHHRAEPLGRGREGPLPAGLEDVAPLSAPRRSQPAGHSGRIEPSAPPWGGGSLPKGRTPGPSSNLHDRAMARLGLLRYSHA